MVIAKFLAAVLALVLLAAPAYAEPLTISGTVTYQEKLALPAGATLHVGLVALPGGTAVVGAGTILQSRSTPPLGFSLNVRGALDPDGRYGLVAEISANGATVFRNPVPVPLDLSSGEPVSILVQRLPDIRPSAAPPKGAPLPDQAMLETLWRTTSIGGRPVLVGKAPTLQIAPDLRAGGSGGCNSYFAQASYEDGDLTFGPAASTRIACAQDVMAQEAEFFAALAAITHYELDEHGLRLLDPAGVPLIGLVASGAD